MTCPEIVFSQYISLTLAQRRNNVSNDDQRLSKIPKVVSARTTCSPNTGSAMGHRLRRWPIVKPTFDQRLVLPPPPSANRRRRYKNVLMLVQRRIVKPAGLGTK